MDTKLAFLHEVLGVEGTRALLKAGEQSQKLENVIVPRTILSWVSAASTMSYEGVLPGVEGFIGFNKSECNGEIKIGQDTYEFENAGVFSVAAAIAVSLGVHEDRLAADLKDKDIVRLGKSIDLLVKSKMAKAEIAKHDFDEVPPEKFESAISRHPNLSSVDANRDYSRKRTYLSSDGMAGYAVTNEGELCHVFSLKPGRGAAAVQHAIAGGATHLNCFDGKLPKYYNQFGFQEEHRERNTDGTGPDVVYMQLPVVHKAEDWFEEELRKSPLVTPADQAYEMSYVQNLTPDKFDPIKSTPIGNGRYHHVYALKDKTAYTPYWGEGFQGYSRGLSSAYKNLAIANGSFGDGRNYFKHVISDHPTPFQGQMLSEVEGFAGQGQPVEIIASRTNPRLPRGQGLGKLAYLAAAAHHGGITSGTSVSANATKAYQSFASNPALKVSLGKEGFRDSRHQVTVLDPKAFHAQLYGQSVEKGEADGPSKGKAAAPGFSQPTQAQAPSRQQGKPPKPSKTMGTPVIPQPAEPDPVRQDNKIANNPSFRVSKSEARKLCAVCMSPQFNNDKFTGCKCLSDIAKNEGVKTRRGPMGYTIEFKAGTDFDTIATILQAIKE